MFQPARAHVGAMAAALSLQGPRRERATTSAASSAPIGRWLISTYRASWSSIEYTPIVVSWFDPVSLSSLLLQLLLLLLLTEDDGEIGGQGTCNVAPSLSRCDAMLADKLSAATGSVCDDPPEACRCLRHSMPVGVLSAVASATGVPIVLLPVI